MEKDLILEIAANIRRTEMRLRNAGDKLLSKEAKKIGGKIRKASSLTKAQKFERELNQKIREKYIARLNNKSVYDSCRGRIARGVFIQASLIELMAPTKSVTWSGGEIPNEKNRSQLPVLPNEEVVEDSNRTSIKLNFPEDLVSVRRGKYFRNTVSGRKTRARQLLNYFLLCLALCALPIFCTIEKRIYGPGYFIQRSVKSSLKPYYFSGDQRNSLTNTPIDFFHKNPFLLDTQRDNTRTVFDSSIPFHATGKRLFVASDKVKSLIKNNAGIVSKKNEQSKTVPEQNNFSIKGDENKNGFFRLLFAFLLGALCMRLIMSLLRGLTNFRSSNSTDFPQENNSSAFLAEENKKSEIRKIADRVNRFGDRFANANRKNEELAARKASIAIYQSDNLAAAQDLEKSFKAIYVIPDQNSNVEYLTSNDLLSDDVGYPPPETLEELQDELQFEVPAASPPAEETPQDDQYSTNSADQSTENSDAAAQAEADAANAQAAEEEAAAQAAAEQAAADDATAKAAAEQAAADEAAVKAAEDQAQADQLAADQAAAKATAEQDAAAKAADEAAAKAAVDEAEEAKAVEEAAATKAAEDQAAKDAESKAADEATNKAAADKETADKAAKAAAAKEPALEVVDYLSVAQTTTDIALDKATKTTPYADAVTEGVINAETVEKISGGVKVGGALLGGISVGSDINTISNWNETTTTAQKAYDVSNAVLDTSLLVGGIAVAGTGLAVSTPFVVAGTVVGVAAKIYIHYNPLTPEK